jgi:hypothetical protein
MKMSPLSENFMYALQGERLSEFSVLSEVLCRRECDVIGVSIFDVHLVAGARVFLPGAGVDGIVLPFFAAAYEEHNEAEDEHDDAPGEIEVDAHGFFVDDVAVAGDEAVEAHEAADEEEDEAEGDANV